VPDLAWGLATGCVLSLLGQVMLLVSFVTVWECHVRFAKNAAREGVEACVVKEIAEEPDESTVDVTTRT